MSITILYVYNIHDCRGRVRIIYARPTISLFRLRDYTTTVTIKITRIGNYIYNNNDDNNNNNNIIYDLGQHRKCIIIQAERRRRGPNLCVCVCASAV